MNEYSTAFQMACVPGPDAAAGMTRLPGGGPVLVVYLDPVNITIQAPPVRSRELAAFCRELAREAAKLAAQIDPDGESAPSEVTRPRHALVRDQFGDSGAGR